MAYLTPRQKAAVVLSSLPPDGAQQLLEELSPRQARDLNLALWELPSLDPAERDRILEEFLGGDPPPRPFAYLDRVPPEQLAPLVLREQPRTIALLLSQLSLGQATAILELLPGPVRANVIEEALELLVGNL